MRIRIKEYAELVVDQDQKILDAIEKEEKFIKEIYREIVEDLLDIGERARKEDVATSIFELERYVEHLRNLARINVNTGFRNRLIVLITRINEIISLWRYGAKLNDDTKIKSAMSSIIGAIRNSILPDLQEKSDRLKRLEEEFSHR